MAQNQNLTSSYKLGFILFAMIFINSCCADIENNEVGEAAEPEFRMIQGIKVYQGDRHCILVGGLCVHTSDCNEPTTIKGLCPTKRHLGVECCYELPMRPAPCEQHLGQCMDRCNHMLTRPGTDCENGQVCCVLI